MTTQTIKGILLGSAIGSVVVRARFSRLAGSVTLLLVGISLSAKACPPDNPHFGLRAACSAGSAAFAVWEIHTLFRSNGDGRTYAHEIRNSTIAFERPDASFNTR